MTAPSITTAMLMAAGLGTRMRPLTNTLPKPLIPVGGRAMIDHLLDALLAAGVSRAVVNVHWLADLMEAHLGQRTDIEIVVSDERAQLLETGGGLVKALPLLGDGPVFVLNTDAFWWPVNPQPLEALAAAFDTATMDECLLLARTENSLGFDGAGDFQRDPGGRLHRRGSAPTAPYAFAGARICDLTRYRTRSPVPFSANRVWDESLALGRLHGVVMEPFWLHVGDPDALEKARRHVGEPGGS